MTTAGGVVAGLFEKILPVGLVANGLLTGLYLAFACAVGPALRRVDDRAFVDVFRAINSAILNGWFLTIFVLAPLVAVAAAGWAVATQRPGSGWLIAAAVCAAATFVITVAANVPLNQALDAAPTGTSAEYQAARLAFENAWARWNLVRTLTGLGAVILLVGAR